jgi:hypothetical protein
MNGGRINIKMTVKTARSNPESDKYKAAVLVIELPLSGIHT